MFSSRKGRTSSSPCALAPVVESNGFFLLITWLVLFSCLCVSQPATYGDEPDGAEDERAASDEALRIEGSLVDFTRDVWPILESHCLECHGPEDAKNDFRMDEYETVMDYLEPGDLESSSLWTDYLVTDDPDMRMPPVDHGSLSGPELATLRLWIEEGAAWPEELPAASEASLPVEEETAAIPSTVAARVWTFQGLFHPATVHFPVALLLVSSAMVLLSFFSRQSFEPVAFHCLWIGALGAIASCLTGWSYAPHEGYGAGFSFDLTNSAIDRHRWLGIGTAVVAVVLIPMASFARSKGDLGMRITWLIGSIIMAVAVSFSGYQGGELTYGEDHYQKEFDRLFPEYGQTKTTASPETSITAESTAENLQPSRDPEDAPEDEPAQEPAETPGENGEEDPPVAEAVEGASKQSAGDPVEESDAAATAGTETKADQS